MSRTLERQRRASRASLEAKKAMLEASIAEYKNRRNRLGKDKEHNAERQFLNSQIIMQQAQLGEVKKQIADMSS